jgi:hypothetical protein
MPFLILTLVLIVEVVVPTVVIFMFASAFVSVIHGAPYVPMGQNKVHHLLEGADIQSSDVLFDLGCGDGRILLAGVREYHVKKAVGYEVAPWPYWRCRWNIWRSGLKNIEVRHQNFFESDLKEATLVYAYLFPKLMNRLAKKLARDLAPGARVFCPAFPINLTEFPEFRLIKEEKIAKLTTYLYQKI